MSLRLKIAFGSLAVGIAALALKYLAYALTGSTALYADALETIVNVASSLATIFAVWLAAKPADSNHPYGHDKVEYFAAVLVGVLIVLASLSIFHNAWEGYTSGNIANYSVLGLGINALAAVLNGIWARVLLQVGKKHRSPALRADGKHLLSDVVTSAGVLVGVIIVALTGWSVIDPILAGLVGINVLWTGWGVMKDSLSGLMDEAASDEVQARIRQMITDHGDGALEAHDLRTRLAGRVTFVDFHLVVPGELSVNAAHEICDRVEQAIGKAVPGARVTIHVEPDHEAIHRGVLVL